MNYCEFFLNFWSWFALGKNWKRKNMFLRLEKKWRVMGQIWPRIHLQRKKILRIPYMACLVQAPFFFVWRCYLKVKISIAYANSGDAPICTVSVNLYRALCIEQWEDVNSHLPASSKNQICKLSWLTWFMAIRKTITNHANLKKAWKFLFLELAGTWELTSSHCMGAMYPKIFLSTERL